jgi:hypothetical protein
MSRANVGFIGLGDQGAPMGEALIGAHSFYLARAAALQGAGTDQTRSRFRPWRSLRIQSSFTQFYLVGARGNLGRFQGQCCSAARKPAPRSLCRYTASYAL